MPQTFVIAEIGVNHNGSMDLARQLIDAAAKAGADAVKFQTFRAEDLVTPDARKADYQIANTGDGGSRRWCLVQSVSRVHRCRRGTSDGGRRRW